ncbi:MAG TPA: adenylate/guanylate cyclase domain-containing protein [Sphingomonas sp.]|nr:adenylate/guanylate cyclase domain-containing protein [Sphingomonas sp.]
MGAIGKRLAQRLTAGGLLLGLVFALFVLADYRWFGLSRIIDQRGGDIMLALRARQRPPSDRVVIVDIDQRSLEQMNDLAGSWPWPRSVHGEMIDHLARQGPRAIAFDILFNEPDIYRPEHDAAFADAVARHPEVWLAMTLNADGDGARMRQLPPAVGVRPLTTPPNDARVPLMLPLVVARHPAAMRGGLINFTVDSDAVGRHHNLHLDRSGWRFPSMAARIMQSLHRPLPSRQTVMLDWRSGWRHVSYADIYLDSLRAHPLRDPNEFRGKIVVIGTSAPGLMDLRLTPLGSTYPGIEILATALDNLDRGDWLREAPRAALLPLALLLIGLVALGFARRVSANRIGYALAAATLVLLAATWVALCYGVFVPVFAPLALGWLFYLGSSALAYLEERAQRLRTSIMFQRFLDPRVVRQLIEQGAIGDRTAAEVRDVTLLFSDIRGFTSLSEAARPEDVVALLNRHFSRQVEVIFAHGGTLDKFIGDAIMAFWGAPVAHPDHARLAVDAAIEMSAALEAMRGEIDELGALGDSLDVGIGIHTGRAVVGFIGSDDRLDYTAIGDTVNLASRIEGLTKGIARILVSQATRDAVGDAYEWRDCGVHQVKGRETAVRLYEPIAKSDRLSLA